MKIKNILFVCTGNTCRSPMAEAMLRHMLHKEGVKNIEIFSRGTSAWPGMSLSEGAREVMKTIGIEPGPHRADILQKKDTEKADLILVMTHGHLERILAEFPGAKPKTFLLKTYASGEEGAAADINDPVGGSPSDYEKCRIDIQNSLFDLMAKLKSEGSLTK